jgi:NADH:ubiquinone oxidoreductase subunit
LVGTDALENRYYQSKKLQAGRIRRWVMYAGSNDSSRVPPEWHGWLHGTVDTAPDEALAKVPQWVKPATPNLTGTELAYKPAGALDKGGARAGAAGDYHAWTPDAA